MPISIGRLGAATVLNLFDPKNEDGNWRAPYDVMPE